MCSKVGWQWKVNYQTDSSSVMRTVSLMPKTYVSPFVFSCCLYWKQESRALSRKEPSRDAEIGLPVQNEYRVIQILYTYCVAVAVGNLCWNAVNAGWLSVMDISANIFG